MSSLHPLKDWSLQHSRGGSIEAHDIPYTTPSGTGFFTRQEVLDCGHLLGWLAEPHDDIALVGVLRSPFFVLADDTLLALRSTGQPLLRTLADPPAAISGDERARCEHAGGVLGELRSAAGSATRDRRTQGDREGKLVSPSLRREAVCMLQARLELSERRACRVTGQHRSTQRRLPAHGRGDDALRTELHAFSRGHPRRGYRRAWATLREEGWTVNRKRV